MSIAPTPDEVLTENAETYRAKNQDYGDSWRLAGETLALWLQHAGCDELRVPADPDSLNAVGLFTRRLDKLIRSFNGQFVAGEMNFESTADAHEDESTYAAMAASLLREGETVEVELDECRRLGMTPEEYADYQDALDDYYRGKEQEDDR